MTLKSSAEYRKELKWELEEAAKVGITYNLIDKGKPKCCPIEGMSKGECDETWSRFKSRVKRLEANIKRTTNRERKQQEERKKEDEERLSKKRKLESKEEYEREVKRQLTEKRADQEKIIRKLFNSLYSELSERFSDPVKVQLLKSIADVQINDFISNLPPLC